MNNFELGYMPHNLRLIIRHLKSLGMTQQQIAQKIGASKYTTLYNWTIDDVNHQQHRDMPHEKWLKLVELYHSTLD